MSDLTVSSTHMRAVTRGGALAMLLAGALVALPSAASARTIDLPKRASVVLAGEHRDDLTGSSVGSAGDVNGDGRADVIVGAPLADPSGRRDAGSAHVVFGGGPRGRVRLGRLGARGFRIDGATARPAGQPRRSWRGAGSRVAGAGDVNGDGLDDLLVTGREAVFVVFGKRDSAPVDLTSLGSGGYVVRLGASPSLDEAHVGRGFAVGDVNGDGRADIAVDLYFPFSEQSGTVAVVYGKADAAPVDIDPEQSLAWGRLVHLGDAATDIAAAGDVNGDGLGDLLIGSPGASTRGRLGSGAVFVLYGRRAAGDEIRVAHGRRFDGFETRGPRMAFGFGYSVARFGRGFVAGAPLGPRGRLTGRGGAWIVPRRNARRISLVGSRSRRPTGVCVDVPGDVTGDRRRDVLVLTHGFRGDTVNARLFSSNGRHTMTYRGLRNGHDAHSEASGAGDTGGDWRADLIFGSPGANTAYIVISR